MVGRSYNEVVVIVHVPASTNIIVGDPVAPSCCPLDERPQTQVLRAVVHLQSDCLGHSILSVGIKFGAKEMLLIF